MSVVTEFRDFILRGNVVDLAVGVVIGGAFGTIVKALIADLITPLIGIFFANPNKPVDFQNVYFRVNGSKFLVGDFLNAVVAFLLISAVVFFFVVKPINHLMSLRKTESSTKETTRECPECLSSIPARASRCAFCTAEVPV